MTKNYFDQFDEPAKKPEVGNQEIKPVEQPGAAQAANPFDQFDPTAFRGVGGGQRKAAQSLDPNAETTGYWSSIGNALGRSWHGGDTAKTSNEYNRQVQRNVRLKKLLAESSAPGGHPLDKEYHTRWLAENEDKLKVLKKEKDELEAALDRNEAVTPVYKQFQKYNEASDLGNAAKTFFGDYGLNALSISSQAAAESSLPTLKSLGISMLELGAKALAARGGRPVSPQMGMGITGAGATAQGAVAGRDATLSNINQNFQEYLRSKKLDPKDEDAVRAYANDNPDEFSKAFDLAVKTGTAAGVAEGTVTGAFSLVPGMQEIKTAVKHPVGKFLIKKGIPYAVEMIKEGGEEAAVSVFSQLAAMMAGNGKKFDPVQPATSFLIGAGSKGVSSGVMDTAKAGATTAWDKATAQTPAQAAAQAALVAAARSTQAAPPPATGAAPATPVPPVAPVAPVTPVTPTTAGVPVQASSVEDEYLVPPPNHPSAFQYEILRDAFNTFGPNHPNTLAAAAAYKAAVSGNPIPAATAPTPVAVEDVEPSPVHPGDDASIEDRREWSNAYTEWINKYGATHWNNGKPKPASYIEGTPEYAARVARENADLAALAAPAAPAPQAASTPATPAPATPTTAATPATATPAAPSTNPGTAPAVAVAADGQGQVNFVPQHIPAHETLDQQGLLTAHSAMEPAQAANSVIGLNAEAHRRTGGLKPADPVFVERIVNSTGEILTQLSSKDQGLAVSTAEGLARMVGKQMEHSYADKDTKYMPSQAVEMAYRKWFYDQMANFLRTGSNKPEAYSQQGLKNFVEKFSKDLLGVAVKRMMQGVTWDERVNAGKIALYVASQPGSGVSELDKGEIRSSLKNIVAEQNAPGFNRDAVRQPLEPVATQSQATAKPAPTTKPVQSAATPTAATPATTPAAKPTAKPKATEQPKKQDRTPSRSVVISKENLEKLNRIVEEGLDDEDGESDPGYEIHPILNEIAKESGFPDKRTMTSALKDKFGKAYEGSDIQKAMKDWSAVKMPIKWDGKTTEIGNTGLSTSIISWDSQNGSKDSLVLFDENGNILFSNEVGGWGRIGYYHHRVDSDSAQNIESQTGKKIDRENNVFDSHLVAEYGKKKAIEIVKGYYQAFIDASREHVKDGGNKKTIVFDLGNADLSVAIEEKNIHIDLLRDIAGVDANASDAEVVKGLEKEFGIKFVHYSDVMNRRDQKLHELEFDLMTQGAERVKPFEGALPASTLTVEQEREAQLYDMLEATLRDPSDEAKKLKEKLSKLNHDGSAYKKARAQLDSMNESYAKRVLNKSGIIRPGESGYKGDKIPMVIPGETNLAQRAEQAGIGEYYARNVPRTPRSYSGEKLKIADAETKKKADLSLKKLKELFGKFDELVKLMRLGESKDIKSDASRLREMRKQIMENMVDMAVSISSGMNYSGEPLSEYDITSEYRGTPAGKASPFLSEVIQIIMKESGEQYRDVYDHTKMPKDSVLALLNKAVSGKLTKSDLQFALDSDSGARRIDVFEEAVSAVYEQVGQQAKPSQPQAKPASTAKPAEPTAEKPRQIGAGQGELIDTSDAFNLSGENVAATQAKPTDTTAELTTEGTEPAYVAQARTQLAKLEKSGKNPQQQQTLRNTIALHERLLVEAGLKPKKVNVVLSKLLIELNAKLDELLSSNKERTKESLLSEGYFSDILAKIKEAGGTTKDVADKLGNTDSDYIKSAFENAQREKSTQLFKDPNGPSGGKIAMLNRADYELTLKGIISSYYEVSSRKAWAKKELKRVMGLPVDATISPETESATTAQTKDIIEEHVARFHDEIKDSLEGAAQGTVSSDKEVNGNKGIIPRVEAALDAVESNPSQGNIGKLLELASEAQDLASRHEEKASNIEDMGREDQFSERSDLIDELNNLADTLNEMAQQLNEQLGTPEAKPAQTEPTQADKDSKTKKERIDRINKMFDQGTITRSEYESMLKDLGVEAEATAGGLKNTLIDKLNSDLESDLKNWESSGGRINNVNTKIDLIVAGKFDDRLAEIGDAGGTVEDLIAGIGPELLKHKDWLKKRLKKVSDVKPAQAEAPRTDIQGIKGLDRGIADQQELVNEAPNEATRQARQLVLDKMKAVKEALKAKPGDNRRLETQRKKLNKLVSENVFRASRSSADMFVQSYEVKEVMDAIQSYESKAGTAETDAESILKPFTDNEPADVTAAREQLASIIKNMSKGEGWSAKRDAAEKLIAQFEAESTLLSGMQTDEIDFEIISDDALNEFMARFTADEVGQEMYDRVGYEIATREDNKERAAAEFGEEGEAVKGDLIADIEGITKSSNGRIAIPTLPAVFGHQELLGLAQQIGKGRFIKLARLPKRYGKIDPKRAETDLEYKKNLKDAADGMLSDLAQALAERGWTQVDPTNANTDVLIDLIARAARGEMLTPEGGVGGVAAQVDMPAEYGVKRLYTPNEDVDTGENPFSRRDADPSAGPAKKVQGKKGVLKDAQKIASNQAQVATDTAPAIDIIHSVEINGKVANIVEQATVQVIMSGTDKARTAQDVAVAVGEWFAQRPQENTAVVVVDKDDRIIHVGRNSIGFISSANMYPVLLMGQALGVTGAAKAWIVHNHPNDTSELSRADIGVSVIFKDLFEGSGIEYKGLIAIAGNKYAYINDKQSAAGAGRNQIPDKLIPQKTPKFKIKITERIFTKKGAFSFGEIMDLKSALSASKVLLEGKPGILLLDGKARPVGAIPMTTDQMLKLRQPGVLGNLLAAIERTNASQLLAYIGDGIHANDAVKITENISSFTAATGEGKVGIEFADVIDSSGNEYGKFRVPRFGQNYNFKNQRDPDADARKADELDRRKKKNAENRAGDPEGRKGYAGIVSRVTDELRLRGGITPKQIEGITRIMNKIGAQFFEGVKMNIRSGPEGAQGQYKTISRIITIFHDAILSGRFEETAAHEIAHHITRFLPEADRQAVLKEMREKRVDFLKKNKGLDTLLSATDRKDWARRRFTPEQVANANFDSFAQVRLLIKLTPEEVKKEGFPKGSTMYRLRLTDETYRLTTPDEYFAEQFKENVMRELNSDPVYLGRSKNWKEKLAGLWETIKVTFRQLFGKDIAAKILRNFAKGRYNPDQEGSTNMGGLGSDQPQMSQGERKIKADPVLTSESRPSGWERGEDGKFITTDYSDEPLYPIGEAFVRKGDGSTTVVNILGKNKMSPERAKQIKAFVADSVVKQALYRGQTQAYETVDLSISTDGLYHVAADPDYAAQYAEDHSKRLPESGTEGAVIQVYINVQNVVDISGIGHSIDSRSKIAKMRKGDTEGGLTTNEHIAAREDEFIAKIISEVQRINQGKDLDLTGLREDLIEAFDEARDDQLNKFQTSIWQVFSSEAIQSIFKRYGVDAIKYSDSDLRTAQGGKKGGQVSYAIADPRRMKAAFAGNDVNTESDNMFQARRDDDGNFQRAFDLGDQGPERFKGKDVISEKEFNEAKKDPKFNEGNWELFSTTLPDPGVSVEEAERTGKKARDPLGQTTTYNYRRKPQPTRMTDPAAETRAQDSLPKPDENIDPEDENPTTLNSVRDASEEQSEDPDLFSAPRKGQTAARTALDIITLRYFSGISAKAHQNAKRYGFSNALKLIANIIHARPGTDSNAFERDLPTAISTARTKYHNRLNKIMDPLRDMLSSFKDSDQGTARQQREEVYQALTDMVTGYRPITGGPLGTAANGLKGLLAELHQYRTEAGEKLGTIQDYFPAVYDSPRIGDNRTAFIKDAKQAYEIELSKLSDEDKAKVLRMEVDAFNDLLAVDPEAVKDSLAEIAEEKAKELYNMHVRGGAAESFDSIFGDRKSMDESPLLKRKFGSESQAIMRKWQVNDPFRVVSRYISSAAKRTEVVRRFGHDGKKWSGYAKEMEKDGVPYPIIQETMELVKSAAGVEIRSLGKASQSYIDTITLFTAASAMGKGFINNLVEPITMGMRAGGGPVGATLTTLRAYVETWARFLRELAAFSPALKRKMGDTFWTQYGQEIGSIHNSFEDAWMTTHSIDMDADNADPRFRWLTNRIYKANLMEASEVAKQQASHAIGYSYILRISEMISGSHWTAKIGLNAKQSATDQLNELGVPPSKHAEFAAWCEDLAKMNSSQRMAAMTANDEMAKLHQEAMIRFSMQSSVRTNRAHKPVFQDTELGKTYLQLMNFSYAYAAEVNTRLYDTIKRSLSFSPPGKKYSVYDRLRMLGPIVIGALSILAYRGLLELKDLLYPTEASQKRKKDPEFLKWLNAISYAGLLGPKFEAAMKMLKREQAPGGPTGQSIVNVGRSAVSAIESVVEGKDMSDSKRSMAKAAVPVGKALLVAGASAVNPVAGAIAVQATNFPQVTGKLVPDKEKKGTLTPEDFMPK